MGKSEKQSGSCHLVTLYRYGGVFHVQLGGRQASEVLIRMRDESGSGLEAVQVTGQLWQLPSAPSPSPAHLLQEVNFLLLGVEDGQGLFMLQLQLLPPFCGLSHVLGRQGETHRSGQPSTLQGAASWVPPQPAGSPV